jgi:hypothetical protein
MDNDTIRGGNIEADDFVTRVGIGLCYVPFVTSTKTCLDKQTLL